MPTPQLLDNAFQLGGMTPDAVKLGFLPLTDLSNANNQSLGAVLRINAALQTTLDVHLLVKLFAEELGRLLPFDGLRYRHAAHDIKIDIGKPARHSCSYRLLVHEDLLGDLKISRRRKFSTDEAMLLEHSVCALGYPLRNALTYLSAVRAAHKDPLTGTSNRAALDSSLLREVELARRHGTSLSMIVVDIDLFKSINDTYGHSIGDDVIKSLTTVIGKAIRKSDMLFRFGGEEFVVLLSNTDRDGALLLAERIRHGVEQTSVRTQHRNIPITVSLGVATLGATDSANTLFEKADKALYIAKSDGRNCVRSLTSAPMLAETV